MKFRISFLLMALVLAVSQIFAATGKKFCTRLMYEYDDRYGWDFVLTLSQHDKDAKLSSNYQCFDKWYDESLTDHHKWESPDPDDEDLGGDDVEIPLDAYTSVQDAIDGYNDYPIDILKFDTDIDFGGLAADGKSCVNAFMPLDAVRKLKVDGQGHTIRGLCYIGAPDRNSDVVDFYAGFFGRSNSTYVINLNFDGAYIKVNAFIPDDNYRASMAGVLVGYAERLDTISNVTISNSKVFGLVAGGLIGYADDSRDIWNVSLQDVSVTLDDAALTDDATNVRAKIGGLAGHLQISQNVSDILLNDVRVESQVECDSLFLGGLIGWMETRFGGVYVANTANVNGSLLYKGSSCLAEKACYRGFIAGKIEQDSYFSIYANYYAKDAKHDSADETPELAGIISPELNSGYSWRNHYYFFRNYRSSGTGAEAGENFNPDLYSFPQGQYNADTNGVVEVKYLQVDRFAAMLNIAAESPSWGNGKVRNSWTRKDGVNDGFPTFATKDMKPIYKIDYCVASDILDELGADRQIWEENGTSSEEKLFWSTYDCSLKVSVTNDYTGKVTANKNWSTYVAKASASADYYWNYQLGDAQGSANLLQDYVYTEAVAFALQKQQSIKVVYQFCQGSMADIDRVCTEIKEMPATEAGNYLFTGKAFDSIESGNTWNVVPYLNVGAISQTGDKNWFKYRPNFFVNVCDAGVCEMKTLNVDTDMFVNVADAFDRMKKELTFNDTIYVQYGGFTYTGDDFYMVDGLGFADYEYHEGMTAVAYDYDVKRELVPTETTGADDFSISTSTSMTPLSGLIENETTRVPYAPVYSIYYKPSKDVFIDSLLVYVLAVEGGYNEVNSHLSGLGYDYLDWIPVKDTLMQLDAPSVLAGEINGGRSNGHEAEMVRIVKIPNGGKIDLSNLYSSEKFLGNGDSILVAPRPIVKAVEYTISFDFSMNPDELRNLFIGDSLIETGYSSVVASRLDDPQWNVGNIGDIYRIGACFNVNWLPSKTYEGRSLKRLRDMLYSEYAEYVKFRDALTIKRISDTKSSFTLYPEWDDNCGGDIRRVEIQSEHGSFKFVQNWMFNGIKEPLVHDADYDGNGMPYLAVPYNTHSGLTMQVYAVPDPGYELDGEISFFNGEKTVKVEDGDKIRIVSWLDDMTLNANFKFRNHTIAFETGRKDVFFGFDSPKVGHYQLQNQDDAIPLPRWVYTSDSCIIGWKPAKDLDRDFPAMREFTFETSWMLTEFQENEGRQDTLKLYPVWESAERCVEEFGYNQVAYSGENGTIVFDEDVLDDNGKKIGVATHVFGAGDKMLLPEYMEGKALTVRSVPEKGFALDSMAMILPNEEVVVLSEESTLGGRLAGASFWASFFPLDTTPMEFADTTLYVSGNAVKLSFKTTEFDIRSKAEVRISLFDAMGNPIVKDSLLSKEIAKTPYKGEWEKYPLRAGLYLIRVTMTNRWKGTYVYEQDFEISDRILAVEKDSWQMVSLNQVDFSKFAWDTSDVRFYWWDEASDFGEFWQYKRLESSREVSENRGYWYSSVKGAELKLKADLPEKIDGHWALDSIYSGWNMVANPYSWYVDVCALNESACGEDHEKPEVEFYSWNATTSSYEEVKYMKPHEAIWAKVSKPMSWELPNVPSYVDVVNSEGDTENAPAADLKKSRALAKAGDKSSWSIQADLRDASGKRHSWNLLGVSSESWNSEVPPAGMGDQVNFAVVDGKKSFIKSFKKASASETYEWNVELNASSERNGFLSFKGVQALNDMGLRVFVTVDGSTTEMKEGQDMGILLKKSATSATVRVAAGPAKTLVYQLNGLRAMKVGSGLQVYFNATDGLAGTTAHVDLMDMNGKVVSSAMAKTVLGVNAVAVSAPRSGLYVLRVRAGNKLQSGQVLVK